MGSSNLRKLKKITWLVLKNLKTKSGKSFVFLLLILLMFVVLIRLPQPLFDEPYATLVLAADNRLLDVTIAQDHQWRFPPLDSIPLKFKTASLLYEDEYFNYHLGVNPVSLLRALHQNISSGEIISGGSTVSMQTIRMALGNKKRTYLQKLTEILLSLKLELKYSKKTIFEYYANHAPFGSNIVGLNAASWRYFSRPPHKLSWGEAAALAVLPNNPAGIYPGNNQKKLIEKRDKLLDKICAKGHLDKDKLKLYKAETIPSKIKALPNHAPHLLQRAISEGMVGKNIKTTLTYALQKKVTAAVKKHNAKMSLNQINNAAALVLEIKTGEVLAYVGNMATKESDEKYVDIVTANRSPGSLLKPMLYAAALDEGLILPRQLVQDIPIYYNGFIPKNFDRKFRGVIPADKALSSSLNVPFVHLLIDYGYKRFYHLLKKIGYTNLNNPPDHYGLSLILGTADTSLWGLTAIYAGMARAYLSYHERPLNSGYSHLDYRSNNYLKTGAKIIKENSLNSSGLLSVEAIEATFKAMQQLKRPEQESGWESFLSVKKIAWKTGTSYGFKDAWAIGLNSDYVVGVWVGNADGEPRSDLVGVRAAAPLLFDLFRMLDGTSIVQDTPMGSPEPVCLRSGMLAKEACEPKVLQELTYNFVIKAKKCTYHVPLKLNQKETHQVNSNCYDVFDIATKNYFVLTPTQSWYYKNFHPNYEMPPPFLNSCMEKTNTSKIQILYPQKNAVISIPKEQGGKQGEIVFQAAHQNPKEKVYWHLDEAFIGATEQNHQISLNVAAGNHMLTLIDNFGNEIKQSFRIVD